MSVLFPIFALRLQDFRLPLLSLCLALHPALASGLYPPQNGIFDKADQELTWTIDFLNLTMVGKGTFWVFSLSFLFLFSILLKKGHIWLISGSGFYA
jgi:hypothetical protein